MCTALKRTRMRAKKSKHADLEKKRKGRLLMGLTVACALSLTAFEWTTYNKNGIALEPLPPIEIEPTDFPPPFRKEQPKLKKTKNPDKFITVDITPDPDPLPEPDPDPKPDPEPGPITADTLVFPPEPVDVTPFTIVEVMPEFQGGEEAMFKWLTKNTKFPAICLDSGIGGKVWVNFVVDEGGNVTNVKVLNDEHKALEKEATRVVRGMPRWKPGEQRGKKVPVYYNLPIVFTVK